MKFATSRLTLLMRVQWKQRISARLSPERDENMSETPYAIARTSARFAFIAEAEIDGQKDRARVSELSARGCYIDSINPLPKETNVRVRIRYGCSTCEFSGTVIYTHAGFGMGVSFGELTGEQRSTLDVWLDELARKLD
jgi:PilZ domain